MAAGSPILVAGPVRRRPDEWVPCNICGADDAKFLLQVDDFKIVECQLCGLAYTNPRLCRDALRNVYETDYFRSPDSVAHGYEDYVAQKPNIQKTFRERWLRMTRFVAKPGRLLEIGCAHGFLLEIAREGGWQVAGIDSSAEAVAYARDVLNLPALRSDDAVLPFPDEHFDAVVMWDVIEHLHDPAASIAECGRKLRAGGILSLITPDRGSTLAKLSGRRWVEYQKPHEHLYFFSRPLIRRLLEREGFEVMWIGTAGKHVSAEFALNRLASLQPRLAGFATKLAEWSGLHKTVLKVNPGDKMYVLARKVSPA